jgi:uncharacterized protein YgfB (UPF0149 family)
MRRATGRWYDAGHPAAAVKSSDDPVTHGETIPFSAVSGALREAGARIDAAEAHGSLCAMTCLLGAAAEDPWLVETLGSKFPAGGGLEALRSLARATAAALEAGDMSLVLVLPADDAPIDVRARGLAEWCHGFGHGLVAAGLDSVGAASAAPVVREVLDDFAELSRAGVDADDAGEAGEDAWSELVEFVRVSVQLVFDELAAARRDASPPVLH